jgi:hypothetical protein
MPPTHTLGSYVGLLAIATTRPFFASSTTTDPESATKLRPVTGSTVLRAVAIDSASTFSATDWTFASRLVTRVSPGVGWVSRPYEITRPIESTDTSRSPGVPTSQRLYAASRPARPTTDIGPILSSPRRLAAASSDCVTGELYPSTWAALMPNGDGYARTLRASAETPG